MTTTSRSLTLLAPAGLPEISAGDGLATLLIGSFADAGTDIVDGDIIVVAQKIVSKAESRRVRLDDIDPGERARALAAETGKDARVAELILRESREIVRTRPGLIIARHKNGYVVANAAVDRSNTGGEAFATLLPEDADRSAAELREAIGKATGASVGIIINDSMGRAWRNGTVGTAIGASGVIALDDRRGRPDRQGVILQSSEIALADEIASAASLLMGQGDEGLPVVLVRGLSWATGGGAAVDLIRPLDQDLFR